jgi:hypothetical protein
MKEISNLNSLSSLNQDKDLTGEKKHFPYQFEKHEFFNRMEQAIQKKEFYIEVITKKDNLGRYGANLKKANNKLVGTTWVTPPLETDTYSKQEIEKKGISLFWNKCT